MTYGRLLFLWPLISLLCLSGIPRTHYFTHAQLFVQDTKNEGYTGKLYPDIRGHSWGCGDHIPKEWRHTSLVCDPSGMLNRSDVVRLNHRLLNLTNDTPCQCQRRSQCTSTDKDGNSYFLGFVVAVALARKLRITWHDPTEEQLLEIAEKFSQTVLGRWALGDCGNSALILVWGEYQKMYIVTGRVTNSYLTGSEINAIRAQVNGKLLKNAYASALLEAIDSIESEMKGEKESKIDAGTLSLIISVGVAVIIVLLITGCVCAFRCCGNLRPEPGTPLGRTLERVDSLKAEVVRRGSQLRRSFSRSPKFARRPSPDDTEEIPNTQNNLLLYEKTSMV